MDSLFIIIILLISAAFSWLRFSIKREQRTKRYHEYLQTDDWQRKRHMVLRRDNWTCVHCGARATQVHHKRYARKNIGREPISWLESVCKSCHEARH